MTRVGFVGVGRMGGPMVRHLVASGHDVAAVGRTEDKRAAVRGLGARPLGTVADAQRPTW